MLGLNLGTGPDRGAATATGPGTGPDRGTAISPDTGPEHSSLARGAGGEGAEAKRLEEVGRLPGSSLTQQLA